MSHENGDKKPYLKSNMESPKLSLFPSSEPPRNEPLGQGSELATTTNDQKCHFVHTTVGYFFPLSL